MLTDVAIRTAKSTQTLAKLSDGQGLQLWVYPDGAKRWRLAYRFTGKQKVLAIGVYPAVSLKEARERRDEARRLLVDGQDPSVAKRVASAARTAASANTFDVLATELLAKKRREAKAPQTLEKIEWLFSLASPAIGGRPITDITAPEILSVLRAVEIRGRHETARRLRSTIGEVFRYAVASGRAKTDPTYALKGALTVPVSRNRAAIIEPTAFGGLLRAIYDYEGAPETREALKLLALTFVRPGELRAAEWSEFDLDVGVWSIQAERMKMKRPHRVPLAPQAVAILRELQTITGRGIFLFPSVRSLVRCMSENTINAALRRLGFKKDEMTGHGFRSAASSILNECGLWNADAIERQLAHVDSDSVRRAYARADFWDERVRMMTYWADRLDEMRAGTPVILQSMNLQRGKSPAEHGDHWQ
jgi:integrase